MNPDAHLPALPILLPLVTAAVVLLFERRGVAMQRGVAAISTALLVWIAVALVRHADTGTITVYLVGDWPARLGIALVADRTSALLVLTTALLGGACLLHASTGWDRQALHFHALFQLQLAGLNGAFLTGDLFNLFVFFEVMLIASYGLLLSGGGGSRLSAGLHYVVFNITASTLFLIALGLLYGTLGTLNMAEMALRVGQAAPADLPLIRAASGILLVVFCSKAALVPLYLWLPDTYTRAPVVVAALFAVMTKVGVYAVLRVYTLVFGADAGALAGWAWPWLLPAALTTLVLATLGTLASSSLRMLAAYLVIASAATLLTAFALATPAAIGAGLYYLVHSTFAAAALFLISDLVRQQRGSIGDSLDVAGPMHGRARLGLMFAVAAIALSGLPPLSGFLGKVMVLAAAPPGAMAWVWSVVLVTSLLTVVAFARTSSQVFWNVPAGSTLTPAPPSTPRAQLLAAAVLLGYGVALSVFGDPVMRYTRTAGEQLLRPSDYIQAAGARVPLLREPSP